MYFRTILQTTLRVVHSPVVEKLPVVDKTLPPDHFYLAKVPNSAWTVYFCGVFQFSWEKVQIVCYALTIYRQLWPSCLLSTIWRKSWESVGWQQQCPASLGPLFHVPHLRQFHFVPWTPPRCRRWRWPKGRQLSVRSGGQLWPRKSCSFRLRLLHTLHLKRIELYGLKPVLHASGNCDWIMQTWICICAYQEISIAENFW